jgi:hypothetical protein
VLQWADAEREKIADDLRTLDPNDKAQRSLMLRLQGQDDILRSFSDNNWHEAVQSFGEMEPEDRPQQE